MSSHPYITAEQPCDDNGNNGIGDSLRSTIGIPAHPPKKKIIPTNTISNILPEYFPLDTIARIMINKILAKMGKATNWIVLRESNLRRKFK
jgi:hypothetical protein